MEGGREMGLCPQRTRLSSSQFPLMLLSTGFPSFLISIAGLSSSPSWMSDAGVPAG